ncbi:hypothetical protein GR702_11525 [Novosphingobium sp. FGD1]|uniref:Uncharacterized protein n=1 Tax=Novosphingobium silvae TaxID=2692619 RepID=A0A7X4K8K1_9SPHN|nr:hypothetical protein [Novosphingobium silvae]MYL98393.1 hypothetical protein [Novosphingobium silvae]
MAEIEALIHQRAEETGSRVKVIRIYSRGQIPDITPDGSLVITGSANVRADIEALPTTYIKGHVVALVTHEGLKMADLSGFTGWSLTIDETPSIWDRQTINVSLESTASHFAAHYALKQLTPTRFQIVLRDDLDPQTAKTMSADDMARTASVLHARVLSDRVSVTTDIGSWSEIVERKALSWSSIWSPEQLPVFDHVHVLANDFDHSVTFQIFRKRWPELVWERLDRPTRRRYEHRDVVIRYHADAHEASRSLFSSERGQRHLRMIALDLAAQFSPTNHMWTCNSRDEPLFNYPDRDQGAIAPGVKLSPRQQGSNRFQSINNATIIYTAKPDNTDIAMFEEIGLDPQYITDSRERETIVQFSTRTSVRDAASTATVTITVYDREQAEHLERYFLRTGYCRPTLQLVDLGFAGYVHNSTAGRPRTVRTAEQTKARDDKRREQARLRKQAQRQRQKAA